MKGGIKRDKRKQRKAMRGHTKIRRGNELKRKQWEAEEG